MPTYEYRCRDCGEEHEVVQSFQDDALTECPACGGSLRKLFGNVGITFKGSGFYKTDSRSGSTVGGSTSSSGGDKGGSSDSGSSDGGSSGSGDKAAASSNGSKDSGTSSSSSKSTAAAKPSSD
jgi:putative FmdB family regulatory protein